MSCMKKYLLIVILIVLMVVTGVVVAVNYPVCSKEHGMLYYSEAITAPCYKDKRALRSYCRRMGLNTNYCILVNYSIPSGKPRFFIYDFNKKRIVYRYRCAHGIGGGSTARKAVFSNSYNSKCSSLGKFVITGIGSAHYKNCFRLKGLDETNNNAEKRGILVHAARNVTYHKFLRWMFLSRSCEGCLTITKGGLMKIHELYGKEMNRRFLIYSYISERND